MEEGKLAEPRPPGADGHRAPPGAPSAARREVRPLDFADSAGLTASLRGAGTLYNTYWVRFPTGAVDHQTAVANSRTLFHAARAAGVRRIVHVSITHPSAASPYSYFRGKAEVESILDEAGVSYAILRPAILFGGEGVLINNIAWLPRRLPVFAVGGTGAYRIRPVHIDDLARLCLAAGSTTETYTPDAVGPEQPTFYELVCFIRDAIGSRSRVVRVPGALIPAAAQVLGRALRDTLLTGDEYRAMADGLADTDGPATGQVAAYHGLNGRRSGGREKDRRVVVQHAARAEAPDRRLRSAGALDPQARPGGSAGVLLDLTCHSG